MAAAEEANKLLKREYDRRKPRADIGLSKAASRRIGRSVDNSHA